MRTLLLSILILPILSLAADDKDHKKANQASRIPSLSRVTPAATHRAQPNARNSVTPSLNKHTQVQRQVIAIKRNTPQAKAFQQRHGGQRQAAKAVQNRFRSNHPNYRNWFDDRFYANHHFKPNYYNRGDYRWRRPQWTVINNWFGWGWGEPIYYDYSGDWYQYNPEIDTDYYQEVQYAVQPAAQPAVEYDVQGDWLPLGEFVAGKDATEASFSKLFFQLAVSRQGDVAGTYYNVATDLTYHIDGIVDQATQQIVWRLTENANSPIFTTGIYNLSQDVAPVQIRFPDDTVQNWVFVRIQ